MAKERIPIQGEEEHEEHLVPDTDHLKDRMDKSHMPGPEEGTESGRGQERQDERPREPRQQGGRRQVQDQQEPRRDQRGGRPGERAQRSERQEPRPGAEQGRDRSDQGTQHAQDRTRAQRQERQEQRQKGSRSGRKDIEEKAVRMLIDTLREKGVSEEFIENNREKIREKALQQLYGRQDRRRTGRGQRRR